MTQIQIQKYDNWMANIQNTYVRIERMERIEKRINIFQRILKKYDFGKYDGYESRITKLENFTRNNCKPGNSRATSPPPLVYIQNPVNSDPKPSRGGGMTLAEKKRFRELYLTVMKL